MIKFDSALGTWIGLSTDDRTHIAEDGVRILDTDTNETYIYYGDTWYKYPTAAGGGDPIVPSTFVIAPSDAVNRERADFIFTEDGIDANGTNTEIPLMNQALANLAVLDDNSAITSTTQTSANTTNIKLNSGASSENYYYVGGYLIISGQTKLITNYVGSTRVATLESALSSLPASGTSYTIKWNIPVRIDFLAGNITGINESIVFPSNSSVYGNGVVLRAKGEQAEYSGSEPDLAPFVGYIINRTCKLLNGFKFGLEPDLWNWSGTGAISSNLCDVSDCSAYCPALFGGNTLHYHHVILDIGKGDISNFHITSTLQGNVGIALKEGVTHDCTLKGVVEFTSGIVVNNGNVYNCSIGTVEDSIGIAVTTGNVCGCKIDSLPGNNGDVIGINVTTGSVWNCSLGDINGWGNSYGIWVVTGNIYNCKIASASWLGEASLLAGGSIYDCEITGDVQGSIGIKASGTNIVVSGNKIGSCIGNPSGDIAMYVNSTNGLITGNNIGEVDVSNTAIVIAGTTIKKNNVENNIFVAN